MGGTVLLEAGSTWSRQKYTLNEIVRLYNDGNINLSKNTNIVQLSPTHKKNIRKMIKYFEQDDPAY